MKLRVIAALVVMAVAGAIAIPNRALAVTCPDGTLNAGIDLPIAECNIDQEKNTTDLMSTISTIISVVLGIVGLVAVVMMILGGIGFVTSQGEAGKVAKAKNTILYGLVGLVISLLAFAIVNFVLSGVFKTANDTGGGSSDNSSVNVKSGGNQVQYQKN